MYKMYCANQSNSLTTVDYQIRKSPQFKKNLEICHSDPRCKGLTLQSFLIKPIQRVCKYPLLIRVCFPFFLLNFIYLLFINQIK